MKKLFALLLVLAMLLSIFTACAKTETPAAPTETKTENTDTNTETKTEAPVETKTEAPAETKTEETPSWKEEHPTWLCEEKTTLSVYTWEGVSSSFIPPSNDLFFWQYMEDYTNVHIDWEVVPYADFNTLIAAKLASGGKLNDIIMMGDSAQVSLDAGSNGMLVDLAPHFNDWFPLINSYMDNAGINYENDIKNYDGTIYAISGMNAPVENRIQLLYNTKWMEQLGLEFPSTIDEFTEMLHKVQEAGDINGNGVVDEIPFTSASVGMLLAAVGTAFGVETIESSPYYAANEDGVVFPEYTSENMRAMLGWLNELYGENLLDSEITVNTMDIISEKVAADRVFCAAYYSSGTRSYSNLTSYNQEEGKKDSEVYNIWLPLTSEWNDHPRMTMYSNYNMFTGISSDCENPELAARWLDTLVAGEPGLIVRCCGKEGETFYFDENHEPQIIMPADGSSWNIKSLGCGQIALPHIQTDRQLLFSATATRPWYTDRYAMIRDRNNVDWRMPSVPKLPGLTEEETELRDTYLADVTAGWEEYRDKFITGALDTDADWDAYIEIMNKLGMNDLMACYQSIYDRTH